MNAEAKYYSRKDLQLRPDIPGASMWAVTLEHTQFTCFEVDPHASFESHSHVSEQITMVLEGELFFELPGRTVCVGAGEVIAIPSNLPHAVFTREKPARAVDAWSPVMDKYKS